MDRETGKITFKVGEPVIEPATETVIKVPATDAEKVYMEGDNEVKEITKYEVDENTGEIKETVTKEIIGTREKILPPVVEIPEYNKPISTNTPVDENGDLILPPTVDIPEYKGVISTNTPVDDNGELILPPIVDIPEYTGTISTNTPVDDNGKLILPPVVEKDDYKISEVKQDESKEEVTKEVKKSLPKTIATQGTAYVLGVLLGVSGLKFRRENK